MSFAEAAQRVGGLAEVLRAAGIRRCDLVMTTARTTPPYLLCWLALAALGAVTVPVNPRSAPAKSWPGWPGRPSRGWLITDAGLAGLCGRRGCPLTCLELGVSMRTRCSPRAAEAGDVGRAAGRRQPGRRGRR